MKREKILWVATSPETGGGVASVLRTMQKTKLFQDFDIQLIASHKDGGTADKALAYVQGFAQYTKLCFSDKPSIVHIHTASYGSFARKLTFFWLAKSLGIPTVIHVHGAEFALFYERAHPALQSAVRGVLGNASAVIALGDIWKARLLNIAPKANVVVVPNGIDLVGFETNKKPIANAAAKVVFLAELSPHKGLFELLNAWAVVQKNLKSPAKLLIGGHGDATPFVERAKSLGITNSTEFLGRLPREQARALMSEADVFVLPSHNEGQPMALLEAMAVGAAIVSTPVGGIPDMIENEKSGLVVPTRNENALSEALLRLLADENLRAQLGAGALDRVHQEFDVNRVAEKVDALYKNILNKSSLNPSNAASSESEQ